ncbi:MFS transporter [Streptacidiphilus sp. EB129]|uniref:MFS transporter n=1 Tax=Streptacidiphilus sp. EB129 TaxID=3156262 RepID=UPI0035121D9A
MSVSRPRFPGERALVAGITVDALGSGMYVPFSLVFFRHVTGLSLPLIGLVLTVTGLLGMTVLPMAGAAVDRFGARQMQLALYVVRGLGFACYPLATSLPVFAAIALVTAIGTRAFPAVQQARIAELVGGADRERMQALTRSLSNAGLGAGTLLASLLIATAGDTGYLVAAWLNAASFLIAGLLASRIPAAATALGAAAGPGTARPQRGGGYRLVLRDGPYLALTTANLLIALGYASLAVLLPVYASSWLHLPQSLTGVTFAVNTALCATLGIPAAALARRRFSTRNRAAAAGAGLFAAAFLGQAVLGTVRPHSVPLLMTGLLAAVVLATVGELVHSPAAGALAQSAAPQPLRGRYLAAYQLSWSLANALAPSLFTLLLALDGRLPWLVVAAAALVGGAILLRLERSLPADAVSTRPQAADGRRQSPAPTPARRGGGPDRDRSQPVALV